MVSLPIWNPKLEFFFARFWKMITLVFLEFMSNIQELQKEDNVLRQFCNPILDRDIIIKWSAYKSEFNLVPFGRVIGYDKVFWNADGKSLSYKLKSKALKISVKENEVPTEKILVARVFSLQRQVIYQIKAKRLNYLIKDFISSNFKRPLRADVCKYRPEVGKLIFLKNPQKIMYTTLGILVMKI